MTKRSLGMLLGFSVACIFALLVLIYAMYARLSALEHYYSLNEQMIKERQRLDMEYDQTMRGINDCLERHRVFEEEMQRMDEGKPAEADTRDKSNVKK